ncbi:glycerol-3-phosphate acyltransferase 1-like [Typha angustifolia]|uniref:glycerol-3-phosphate acyltransferase 1-like n=1 Tax=Typha angustifolia TaxID=59011 RepID=UPI003C2E43F8
MVFPRSAVPKILLHWLLTCYRAARRVRSYGFLHKINPSNLYQDPNPLYASVTKCSLEGRGAQTLLCDIQGSLLGSKSPFPYFMLVAFEGGGLLRALLLLLCYPVVWALGQNGEASLKIMTFFTFFGLRKKDMELVARTVLPKFYLETLHFQAYELLASNGRKVVITSLPRVMVDSFLKEYLCVNKVVGAELQVVKDCYFAGLISGSYLSYKQKALEDLFGEAKADVGLVSFSNPNDHLFIPYCKEVYAVAKCSSGVSSTMPREKYPKPLIFHDGRLASLPTPSSVLSLYLFLPIGLILAFIRITSGLILPYKFQYAVVAITGMRYRVDGLRRPSVPGANGGKGAIYVCTHRTLLDPVMLNVALQRSVPAVTYSLSWTSEIIAPMRTVKLTRDRERDAGIMRGLLEVGDLAVCPEGTTCREPYLLRFSPLFAELADMIEPVAMDVAVGTFYGTTASGQKWLDPVVFMMNPMPGYRVKFLGRVSEEMTRAGGRSAAEVANLIQRQLADALGFECTGLTRKDKYLMLAGNAGVVGERKQ